MRIIIAVAICFIASSCFRRSSDSPMLDQRYRLALQYIVADSSRYSARLSEDLKSAGIRVSDTLYCAHLEFFLEEVFEIEYGKYGPDNPLARDFYKREYHRYRNCQGRSLSELADLSDSAGPEIAVFFSEIMHDVLPRRSGISVEVVPHYPGEPDFKRFISSNLTSYEYMFIFDSSGRMDTVLAKMVRR